MSHVPAARRRAPLLAVAAALLLGGGAASGVAVPAVASPSPEPSAREVPACVERLLDLGTRLDDPTYTSAGWLPEVDPSVAGSELDVPGLLVDAAVAPPPRLPATAWLVADLDTGEVLAACNAHVPLAPASTLKVLTAVALTPDLPGDLRYRASEATGAVEGSRVGIVPGSGYTVEDLLHGLWLGSGNDAAVAIAEVAGGEEVALARMAEVARGLGATSTRPRTPHGLDAPGQVSTVHDLAVIGRAALEDPRSARLAATTRYSFPGRGATSDPDRPRFQISTSGRLVRNLDGATGMKSGFTRAAGGAYIGTAERDGRRLVATVLRSQGRPWHHARDLLEWGYGPGAAAAPVGVLAAGPTAEPVATAPSAATSEPPGRPDDDAASRDGGDARDEQAPGEDTEQPTGAVPPSGTAGTAAPAEDVSTGDAPAEGVDDAAAGSATARSATALPGPVAAWLLGGLGLLLALVAGGLAARALGRR